MPPDRQLCGMRSRFMLTMYSQLYLKRLNCPRGPLSTDVTISTIESPNDYVATGWSHAHDWVGHSVESVRSGHRSLHHYPIMSTKITFGRVDVPTDEQIVDQFARDPNWRQLRRLDKRKGDPRELVTVSAHQKIQYHTYRITKAFHNKWPDVGSPDAETMLMFEHGLNQELVSTIIISC